MRRTHTLSITGAALTAMAAISYGLEATNGYEATVLFTTADVQAELVYDAAFTGTRWDALSGVRLGGLRPNPNGNLQADDVAVDSTGNAYALLSRWPDAIGDDHYTGLIRDDGSTIGHLIQDVLENPGPGDDEDHGSEIRGVTVSPVTAGLLVADHPVITRTSRSGPAAETYFEVWSVDPTTSPVTETLVYSWAVYPDWTAAYGNAKGIVRVDAAGDLYVLVQNGVDDASISTTFQQGAIRRLTWNGSAYVESAATGRRGSTGLTLGPSGALYTFASAPGWGVYGRDVDILRIDAATGASAAYATVAPKKGYGFLFQSWGRDADGKLWIGLRDTRTAFRYVTDVRAGESFTRSAADRRIAESVTVVRSLAGGADGSLLLLEQGADRLDDTVYRLAGTQGSGSGGGGGGGGGGKGGGKGKKK